MPVPSLTHKAGPDSVYVECTYPYIFPGIGDSTVYLDLVVFTDNTGNNRVTSLRLLMLVTVSNSALIQVDTSMATVLAGTFLESWSLPVVGVGDPPYDDPTESPFHFVVGGANFYGGLDSGSYVTAHITITVTDTCTICIDTLSSGLPEGPLSFITEGAVGYEARWSATPYCCQVVAIDYLPGDVNMDNRRNIVDVVAIVGHVFRGRELANLQAADVNADCQVTLADVFHLFYFIFKDAEKPLPGCVQ